MTGNLSTRNDLKMVPTPADSAAKTQYLALAIVFCGFESENLSKPNELFDRQSW